MRRSELVGLSRGQLNGRVVYLPRTKNGRARAVPLSSRARVACELLLPFLPIPEPVVSYQWKLARKRAGIEGLTMHDLRHEAVSRLFEKGLTTEEVMSVSGHTTYAMLARYTHLKAERLVSKLG
jgi:integrase